ncbi:MAG: hypothetical protein HPM95_13285 [Alphaproteobacteria bacterium]|nr:hypothetical protein [Alphaproteobacteria bacterium]
MLVARAGPEAYCERITRGGLALAQIGAKCCGKPLLAGVLGVAGAAARSPARRDPPGAMPSSGAALRSVPAGAASKAE